ncbi:TonB-dependent siderophore receptor [Roseateles chitinivorans]|uniref:TonB-dependent siderophore receptor n=1 Tax=Roseateles chitinivorans TaxID=2917965 RepID=UPI003D67FEA1
MHALALAGLSLSSVALAQSAPAPAPAASAARSAAADATLPEVNVRGTGPRETATSAVYGMVARRSATGMKTDTSILEAPQSVSVVTREQIELQGATGVDEAVRYTSGTVGGAFGSDSRSDWILVRGFRPALFLDGLGLPDGTWAGQTRLEPYLLERIEILKGPASVMYGALPPSGFINGVSKRPSAVPVNEIGLEFGSFNKKQLTVDVGGKLAADGSVLFRVAGLARKSDTYVDFAKDDRYAIAPSLLVNFSPATSLLVMGQFQKADTAAAGGFLPADGTLFTNPNGKIPATRFTGEPDYDWYKKESASVGYELSHKLNDSVTLRQNLRYMDFDIDHRTVGAFGLAADRRTLSRYVWTPREDSTSVAIDNQAEFAFATGAARHTLLTGLDYRRVKTDSRSAFDFTGAPPLDIFNPVYGAPITSPADTTHTEQTQKQLGLYLQDQIRLDRWIATLSARHDRVTTDTDDKLGGTTASQKDSKTSARVGLNYVFDSGLAPYVSYSTSFQPTIGTDFFKRAFVPTTGRQVEAGVKYRPANNRALFTAALFDLRQKNVLTPDPDPTHGFASVQQGEVRSRGLELEARFRAVSTLDVITSYTYTDSKVVETDRPVFRQPKNQAQVWVDYRVPEDIMAGLGVGGGVRYVGGSYAYAAADNSRVNTKGYTVLDLQAHYDLENWRFLATVSNVTGKEYIATCQSAAWCFYGYPRTFSVSARYSW